MKNKKLLLVVSLMLAFAMLFGTVSVAAVDADAKSIVTTLPYPEVVPTTEAPTTEDGETEEETTQSEDYENGYNQGYDDGYNDGYGSGYNSGFMNGFWAGNSQGGNDETIFDKINGFFEDIEYQFLELQYQIMSYISNVRSYIMEILGISFIDEDYLAAAEQATLEDDAEAEALCEEFNYIMRKFHYDDIGEISVTKTAKVGIEVTECPGGELTKKLINPIIDEYLVDTEKEYDSTYVVEEIVLYPAGLVEAEKTENADGTTDYRFVLKAETSHFDGEDTCTVDPATKELYSLYDLYHYYCADVLAVEYFDYDPVVINHATILYKGATVTAKADAEGKLIAVQVDMPMAGSCQGVIGPVVLDVALDGYRNEGCVIEYK